MKRGLVVAACTLAGLMLSAQTALACDTGSWLQVVDNPVPGSMTPLRGGGFDAGDVILVWDRSDGEVVGSGEVSSDGRFETDVRIPADAAGRHKIIALDADGGASAADPHAWTDLVVGTPIAEVLPPVGATSRVDARNPGAVAAAAGLAVVAGALLFIVRRRRRSGPTSEAAGSNRAAPVPFAPVWSSATIDREVGHIVDGSAAMDGAACSAEAEAEAEGALVGRVLVDR